MNLETAKKKSLASFRLIFSYKVLVRFMVLIKNWLVAKNLTSFYNMDNYFIGLLSAMFMAEIVGQGIMAALVPVLLRAKIVEGEERRFKALNNILNIAIILSVVLIAINFAFAPKVVSLLNPGVNGADLVNSVNLMRIGLPLILIIIVRDVFFAYLQTNHGFRSGAVSPVAFNLAKIVLLMLFPKIGISGIMFGTVLSYAAYFTVVWPIVKGTGYKYEKIVDTKDEYFKDLLILIVPMMIYLVIGRISSTAMGEVTSKLSLDGSSFMKEAMYVIDIVISLVVATIVTISYPLFADFFIREDKEKLKKVFNKSVELIVTVLVPFTFLFVIFPEQFILLFGKSKTVADVVKSADMLRVLSIGLIPMGLDLIFVRGLYGVRDTYTPIIAGIAKVALTFTVASVIMEANGVIGIGLAMSMLSLVTASIMGHRLTKKYGLLNIYKMAFRAINSMAYTLVPVITVAVFDKLVGNIYSFVFSVVVGLIGYSFIWMYKDNMFDVLVEKKEEQVEA